MSAINIKSEIDQFAHLCLDAHREDIERIVNRSHNDLSAKLLDKIKANISQNMASKDLYDYSDINIENEYTDIVAKLKDKYPMHCFTHSFIEGEKIVIFLTNMKGEVNDAGNVYTFITNYARILSVMCHTDEIRSAPSSYNVWIPTDYIMIMSTLIKLHPYALSLRHLHGTLRGLQSVILSIKDRLYDRKIMPLYLRDDMEKCKEILAKREQYEDECEKFLIERENFEREKRAFMDIEQQHMDIENEKRQLMEERDRLQQEAQKLKLEREKFEREKDAVVMFNL